MQTFLPYPDFAESAKVLDSPRLGKQRVETLQILRALTFPSYGWASHPAKVMWTGYVPALTRYGLAMVDAWTARGAADSTRAQISEFAPEAETTPLSELALPSWLGNEVLHRSHQSNLIRKDAAFYGPRFPGIPGDLDYFWPGADELVAAVPPVGDPLLILRPRDDTQLEEWFDSGGVTIGETNPRGKASPKWLAHLELFSRAPSGTRIAVLEGSTGRLRTGHLVGGVIPFSDEREVGLRRAAEFDGEIARSAFPYPALLQDPRSLFETIGPVIG